MKVQIHAPTYPWDDYAVYIDGERQPNVYDEDMILDLIGEDNYREFENGKYEFEIPDKLEKIPAEVTIAADIHSNTVWLDGEELPLHPSLKLRNHSPSGFNWGYGGSGPAQLALAILLKYTNREFALRYYQDFKFHFVSRLPRSSFLETYNLKQIINEVKKLSS